MASATATTSTTKTTPDDETMEEQVANMSLEDICEPRQTSNNETEESDGSNKFPIAKFIDDIEGFANSFQPVPATAELLIGAYQELHNKYKHWEAALVQKSNRLKQKVPELDKSIGLIQHLLSRQQQQTSQDDDDDNDGESKKCVVRYSLADSVYGKAEVDPQDNLVNLWLGANVMLEYTYEEALDFLSTNRGQAQRDLQTLTTDLGTIRDQIVTCEVNMSRIYNWDIRRRRQQSTTSSAATTTVPSK